MRRWPMCSEPSLSARSFPSFWPRFCWANGSRRCAACFWRLGSAVFCWWSNRGLARVRAWALPCWRWYFFGSFLVTTRWLAGSFRPRFLVISQLLAGSILLAPLAFAVGAPAMTAWLWLLFAISAFGSALGNLLLAMANRHAPASVIAPLIYTQLLAATVLGWLAFGDWPDALSLTGLAVILASGLWSLRLSRR